MCCMVSWNVCSKPQERKGPPVTSAAHQCAFRSCRKDKHECLWESEIRGHSEQHGEVGRWEEKELQVRWGASVYKVLPKKGRASVKHLWKQPEDSVNYWSHLILKVRGRCEEVRSTAEPVFVLYKWHRILISMVIGTWQIFTFKNGYLLPVHSSGKHLTYCTVI